MNRNCGWHGNSKKKEDQDNAWSQSKKHHCGFDAVEIRQSVRQKKDRAQKTPKDTKAVEPEVKGS